MGPRSSEDLGSERGCQRLLPKASGGGAAKLNGLGILAGVASVPFVATIMLIALMAPPEPVSPPFIQGTIIRDLREGRILAVSRYYETLELSPFTQKYGTRSVKAAESSGRSVSVFIQYRLVPENVSVENPDGNLPRGRRPMPRVLRCRLERMCTDSATVSASVVHLPEFADLLGGAQRSTEPLFRVEGNPGRSNPHVRLTIRAWTYLILLS